MLANKLLTSTKGGGSPDVSEMFLVNVRRGTGATVNITAPDMTTDGGLVITTARTTTTGWRYVDTDRGATKSLESNSTSAEATESTGLTAFTSTGVTFGSDVDYNANGQDFVDYFIKKQPRFFDQVKYTGDGVAGREIAHNLGCEVGMIMVKSLDVARNWMVGHRSMNGWDAFMYLDLTNAQNTSGELLWGDGVNLIQPTESVFTVSSDNTANQLGENYIAYLFAHDPLGASGDGSDGNIACGSFTGNGLGGSNGPEVDLGWEPQYVMIKRATGTDANSSWYIHDIMRGIVVNGADSHVQADESDAEYSGNIHLNITPIGFQIVDNSAYINASGNTYIYMAIRRSMKEPTSSSEVFAIDDGNDTGNIPGFTSGFPIDLSIRKAPSLVDNNLIASRLTQGRYMLVNATDAELALPNAAFDYMDGWFSDSSNPLYYSWMFKRAKGFFDVVTYTGDGIAGRDVKHNLGVVPELQITKIRDTSSNWLVHHSGISTSIILDSSDAETGYGIPYFTDMTYRVGISGEPFSTNLSPYKYITCLFATLPGISKVGSYTGNGTSQTIDCGFTTGTKFLIIKRTDSTGDWFMWDSVRGIVAGNDPHLSLNTTAAEVTTDDSIDPDSSGFIVNQVAATNVNVSSAEYIYYSISV